MIRDHVVMSCISSQLWQHVLQEKISLLNFSNAWTMELSDHQASKLGSFLHYDDSVNALSRSAIDQEDTSNVRNRETKWFRCRKSGQLANNKTCKVRSATCNSCQKVGYFDSECLFKSKINSVYEKKPKGIYYIDLSASESDSEFANNITPTYPPPKKKLSKI